jgi:uncharacterized protein YdiU (UPF0061 family)
MAALGIPTTRALAAVTTGEVVLREQRLPGAVLTRVAASHLRVGTFEFFAARHDQEGLELLTAYALERHYPARAKEASDTRERALALLESVRDAQAELVARWLGVGFIHGVMNTDNSSISGETIDYGPCAFLDEYDPGKKFSSIDQGGRYAFGNQPRMAHWNLTRFAETLLPLISSNEDEAAQLATERLDGFGDRFEPAYARVLRGKLGLSLEEESDVTLADDLLGRMAQNHVDHTLAFRALCDAAEDSAHDSRVAALFDDPNAFHEFAPRWRKRIAAESGSPSERAASMRRHNPAFIPRNHRIEQAIVAGTSGDISPFQNLVRALSRPYEEQPDFAYLAEPPLAEERVRATFCGT